MQNNKNILKTEVEEKMRKLFFSTPVITRFFERASNSELESLKKLLDDEAEARTVDRRARFIKTANLLEFRLKKVGILLQILWNFYCKKTRIKSISHFPPR